MFPIGVGVLVALCTTHPRTALAVEDHRHRSLEEGRSCEIRVRSRHPFLPLVERVSYTSKSESEALWRARKNAIEKGWVWWRALYSLLDGTDYV